MCNRSRTSGIAISFAANMNEEDVFAAGKVILVNKPFEWTSFDVVRKIRYLTKTKKVGHAGTLDPLATGLLIVCTGKYTKKINEYMAQEKEYTGSITIGARTPTYDLESNPEHFANYDHLTEHDFEKAAEHFRGAILQTPPIHSAVKQDGKRAYELARQGVDVKLEPRPVTIKEFEITSLELPNLFFKVVCSTGTYIRSLAHDFGERLGCGGYLSGLCRTRIGEFLLQDAFTMESLQEYVQEQLKKDS
ncbi:MAG TPA: tRNA pseudouridine(55) synthase TruB [Chitinophagaceae bacterium]|nr:tRNA pseudouridine(55) synthase TruB [Chitinophagaceae bacterium]